MPLFNRKYILCFILIALFLCVIPTKSFVSAENPSYLSTLPFDQPIGHKKGYADFKGKKTVVIFGRITCTNTTYYVPYINKLVEQSNLEDKLNILFFDIDQTMSAVTSYVNKQAWKNVYTFKGGSNQMWKAVKSQGISNSVAFPAVFYLDEKGAITHYSTNFQNEKQIKSSVNKALNDTTDSTEAIQISVLADTNKISYDNQKAEIIKRLNAINMGLTASYTSKPSATSPHKAGKLTEKYENNALAALNLVRYMSGLSPVKLDTKLSNIAQHGAVLMSASSYGHTPSQPSSMNNDFYKKGYQGTSKGNISKGYTNLTDAIFHGWMADASSSNISSVGHRRWALNPAMGITGFGEYNSLYVMYAFDTSNKANANQFDAIAYPSGVAFPKTLFHGTYPWSISINPNRYTVPDPLSLKVTLENNNKKWEFTLENADFNGNYMNYDTNEYGVSSNIVFRPKGITQYDGTYKVTVEGLKNKAGKKVILQYETTFFDERKPVVTQPASVEQAIKRANSLSLIPTELNKDFNKPITRAELSKLTVILYEKLKGTITPTATFADTKDIYVRKAATVGIVNSVTGRNFHPNDELKREHAAKIVDQLARALGIPSKKGTLTYADTNEITEWVKPFVISVTENKLMTSDANNMFNPKGKYTREQSIIILMRVYDAVKNN